MLSEKGFREGGVIPKHMEQWGGAVCLAKTLSPSKPSLLQAQGFKRDPQHRFPEWGYIVFRGRFWSPYGKDCTVWGCRVGAGSSLLEIEY